MSNAIAAVFRPIPIPKPHVLRSDAHILTTEGVAMMFERFSKNAEFLHNELPGVAIPEHPIGREVRVLPPLLKDRRADLVRQLSAGLTMDLIVFAAVPVVLLGVAALFMLGSLTYTDALRRLSRLAQLQGLVTRRWPLELGVHALSAVAINYPSLFAARTRNVYVPGPRFV